MTMKPRLWPDTRMNATFSDCGSFRYLLWSVWDSTKPILPWLLFNPSVAGTLLEGTIQPDPTWTKGRGFSERLGYGGQVFVNAYAFVATYPKDLRAAGYLVGPENDRCILEGCAMGPGLVVIAYGALARKLARPPEALALIRRAGYKTMCLGRTDDGLPRHPLMLSYSTPLEPFNA